MGHYLDPRYAVCWGQWATICQGLKITGGLYTSVALVPMDSSGYSQLIVTLILMSHTAGSPDKNMGVIKVGNKDMHNANERQN